MNESFADLGKAMIVAVFSVYVVMLIAFGEATAPFTILFSLPDAVIGGFVGPADCRSADQCAGFDRGIDVDRDRGHQCDRLCGSCATDEKTRAQYRGCVVGSGETRLRPILMTAFATIFALLPLALGYGEGAAMSQGLAIVVIGGLASSTFLTLFIVPIVYLFLSQLQERRQSKRSQQAEA